MDARAAYEQDDGPKHEAQHFWLIFRSRSRGDERVPARSRSQRHATITLNYPWSRFSAMPPSPLITLGPGCSHVPGIAIPGIVTVSGAPRGSPFQPPQGGAEVSSSGGL